MLERTIENNQPDTESQGVQDGPRVYGGREIRRTAQTQGRQGENCGRPEGTSTKGVTTTEYYEPKRTALFYCLPTNHTNKEP